MLPELSEIRRRRRAAGMSQKALARLARTSQATLSKIETGGTDPSYSVARKVLDSLEELEGAKGRTLGELANRRILSVEPADLVGKALRIMRGKDISQLPVFRGALPVGSVSERFLLEGIRKGKTIEEIAKMKISEVMGPPFPVLPESTGAERASFLLENFSAVLVSDRAGRIAGIVTRTDLLKRER
jgi:predicted transcriptional regulator